MTTIIIILYVQWSPLTSSCASTVDRFVPPGTGYKAVDEVPSPDSLLLFCSTFLCVCFFNFFLTCSDNHYKSRSTRQDGQRSHNDEILTASCTFFASKVVRLFSALALFSILVSVLQVIFLIILLIVNLICLFYNM